MFDKSLSHFPSPIARSLPAVAVDYLLRTLKLKGIISKGDVISIMNTVGTVREHQVNPERQVNAVFRQRDSKLRTPTEQIGYPGM